MTKNYLSVKIACLEAELKVLKAEIENLEKETPDKKGRLPTISSLKGYWHGKGNFSDTEIRQAELRLPDEI